MPDKSVAEKLQFKPGRKILLVNPPSEIDSLLGTLPDGVILLKEAQPPVEIIAVFIRDRQELEAQLRHLRALLDPKGMIWVIYYKGTARVKTDIHRDSINAYAQTLGLTGVAMISVDQDWSALRLKVV
jgi:hypothetical protein